MKSVKSFLKRVLPQPAAVKLAQGYDALKRTAELPAAALHPWRRDTIRQLGDFKDKHAGERCFIIGNGPSLKQMDLSPLRNEFTMGMNRIYMLFHELGFQTTYYLSVNDLVIEQCATNIQNLKLPRFVSWRSRKWLNPEKDLFFLHTTYTGPKFSEDIRHRLWEGATVTYTALQVAFYLGFQTVILIGVDHNFVTKGVPNTTVVSSGDDPNHFHPGYFGKGFRWQLPDLETSEIAYNKAKTAYSSAGRQVLDATFGGKLTVFEKVSYNDLF